MTNIELEQKIKDLIHIDNYFDMIIAMKAFEKEYKNSDFYKATHQNLFDTIKGARMHYILQFDDVFKLLQDKINTLNLDNLNHIIEQFGDQLTGANINNQELLQELKTQIEDIK